MLCSWRGPWLCSFLAFAQNRQRRMGVSFTRTVRGEKEDAKWKGCRQKTRLLVLTGKRIELGRNCDAKKGRSAPLLNDEGQNETHPSSRA